MAVELTLDERKAANRAAFACSGQPVMQYWLEEKLAQAQAEIEGLRDVPPPPSSAATVAALEAAARELAADAVKLEAEMGG